MSDHPFPIVTTAKAGRAATGQRDIRHFALEYFDRRWHFVPALGKAPAVNWKRFQTEMPSRADLDHWFGASAPETRKEPLNIAILTGKATGLVVVDCDNASEAEWFYDHHPTTLISRSGRGYHLWYRYCIGIRNRARLFGRPIDIRGDGGVVIAPPSIHLDTGSTYSWLSGFDPYDLDAIPVLDLCWITDSPDHCDLPQQPEFLPKPPMIQDLLAYCLQIPSIQGQSGSNGCYRVACLCRESGLTLDETLEFLKHWQERSDLVRPKWNAQELLHKVRSAYAKGRRERI